MVGMDIVPSEENVGTLTVMEGFSQPGGEVRVPMEKEERREGEDSRTAAEIPLPLVVEIADSPEEVLPISQAVPSLSKGMSPTLIGEIDELAEV